MCVPEKTGGRPCQGQSVRTKACNTKACPKVGNLAPGLKKTKKNKVLTPIWKVLPFSSRPQRYIKCQVKESDVLYKTKINGTSVKLPARMVMNNHTLALFEDEDYTNNIFTFNIHEVLIQKNKQDHCCIVVRSNNKRFDLCGFSADCGTVKDPKFFNSWSHDFTMFSHSCYTPHDIGNGLSEDTKLQDEFQKKITEAQIDVIHEREKLLEKKLEKKDTNKLQGKVTNTQKTVMKAIRKELKLEDLIKKEEQDKVDSSTSDLMVKYKYEKRKKRCLENVLKKKEEEDVKNREVKEAKNQIEKIKQDAVVQVEKKRVQLRKKIIDIRKKAQRKNRVIEQKIQKIRGAMASDLMVANKLGDWRVCKKARDNKKLVNDYCNSNFIDNQVKNQDCREGDNFCYICCENEYGNMYIKKRDKCYDMCDEQSKKDMSSGEWVWNPSLKKLD